MIVHFKKDSDNNFVLHCVRKDGTETYQKYHWGVFQIEHDLMHFVVESTFGYKNAFYGILASGKDISWFAEMAEGETKKPKPSDEAMTAEIIAGTLQILRDNDEFLEHLKNAFETQGIPVPHITLEQVIAIRKSVAELLEEWQASEKGITREFVEN